MATKLYLPNLLEYIYDCIVEKGFKHLFNRLDREDFLKVKNEAKARKFAEHGNMEDKILLLSKLGIGVGLVFWNREREGMKKVQDVIIANIGADQTNLTKTIIKEKTFAARDIDFIKSLVTMSAASMSKVYSVNRKFLHIKDSAHNLKTRTLINKFEAEKNLEWYSQTIQQALDIEPILEGFKIDILQFRVLLYLHTSPNGATKNNIARKLNKSNITGMINKMYKINLVSFGLNNKEIILIDVYGVIILEQIFSKFPS